MHAIQHLQTSIHMVASIAVLYKDIVIVIGGAGIVAILYLQICNGSWLFWTYYDIAYVLADTIIPVSDHNIEHLLLAGTSMYLFRNMIIEYMLSGSASGCIYLNMDDICTP